MGFYSCAIERLLHLRSLIQRRREWAHRRWRRGTMVERRVWSDGVAVILPLRDDDLSRSQAVKCVADLKL